MAAQSVKRFKEEMCDFHIWARWVDRSDVGTIRRICGLTHALSIPTVLMGLADRWDRDENGAPIIYDQETAAEPPTTAYGVQDFMEKLQAGSPGIHAALVARHLRRVGGEPQPISSESQMAMKLYGLDRSQSHTRLMKDCDRGYEAYRLYSSLMGIQSPFAIMALLYAGEVLMNAELARTPAAAGLSELDGDEPKA